MDNMEKTLRTIMEGMDPENKEKFRKEIFDQTIYGSGGAKEMNEKFAVARLKDIATILLFIVLAAIVIILFTQSLFEGFISFVAAFFFVRYLIQKRRENWPYSWF